MEAAWCARNSAWAPLRLQRALSFWVDQRTSSGAARLLLPIVKIAIYLPRIVHGRDGEYSGVGDIRAHDRPL